MNNFGWIIVVAIAIGVNLYGCEDSNNNATGKLDGLTAEEWRDNYYEAEAAERDLRVCVQTALNWQQAKEC